MFHGCNYTCKPHQTQHNTLCAHCSLSYREREWVRVSERGHSATQYTHNNRKINILVVHTALLRCISHFSWISSLFRLMPTNQSIRIVHFIPYSVVALQTFATNPSRSLDFPFLCPHPPDTLLADVQKSVVEWKWKENKANTLQKQQLHQQKQRDIIHEYII